MTVRKAPALEAEPEPPPPVPPAIPDVIENNRRARES
jgi:hypothetical protein